MARGGSGGVACNTAAKTEAADSEKRCSEDEGQKWQWAEPIFLNVMLVRNVRITASGWRCWMLDDAISTLWRGMDVLMGMWKSGGSL